MIPSLVALIQEAGLSEDAKRQAAHALAMLAAEDGVFFLFQTLCKRLLHLHVCHRMGRAMLCGKRKLVLH